MAEQKLVEAKHVLAGLTDLEALGGVFRSTRIAVEGAFQGARHLAAMVREGTAPGLALMRFAHDLQEHHERHELRAGGSMSNPGGILLGPVEELNREMVAPALRAALSGDLPSRQFYEQHRSLSFRLLPEWAQKTLERQCEGFYHRVNREKFGLLAIFDMGITRQQLKLASKLSDLKAPELLPPLIPPIAIHLGLDSTVTYEHGQAMAARLAECDLGDYRPARLTEHFGERSSQRKFWRGISMFSPTTVGPVGDAARAAFSSGLNYMLRVRVLTDFLSAEGLALSDQLCEAILKGVGSPWDLSKSRPLCNLLALQRAFESDYPHVAAADRERIMLSLLKSKDPVAQLHTLFNRGLQAHQPQTLPVRPRASLVEERIESSLAKIIHEGHVWMPSRAVKQYARRYAALIRRGACTYTEVAAQLLKSESPEQLLDIYYQRIRRRREQAQILPQVIRVLETAPRELAEYAPIRLEYLTLSGRTPFREWLGKLDGMTQARIEGRLERLTEGNPGDVKGLRKGLKGLQELRLAFGPIYRIYLKRIAPDSYLIAWGGIKATQDRDIRFAARLVHLWESSSGTEEGEAQDLASQLDSK